MLGRQEATCKQQACVDGMPFNSFDDVINFLSHGKRLSPLVSTEPND
jgi:hypothetical protein